MTFNNEEKKHELNLKPRKKKRKRHFNPTVHGKFWHSGHLIFIGRKKMATKQQQVKKKHFIVEN